MDGWFYIYHIKFYDELIGADKEETGILYVPTGYFKDACDTIIEYYGDDNLEGMLVKPLVEGPCLRKDQIEKINWKVDDFNAENAL